MPGSAPASFTVQSQETVEWDGAVHNLEQFRRDQFSGHSPIRRFCFSGIISFGYWARHMASGANETPPPAERRPARRKQALLTAIITYNDGAFSFTCTIRDLSETGARLDVGKTAQFPSDFFLINIRDRTAYDARVVWNHGAKIGVSFKKIYPLSDIVDPSLAYLKRLWMAKAAR